MRSKGLFIPVLILVMVGCMSAQPPVRTQYYMLSYASPTIKDTVRLDASLKVERFSVAQFYNSDSMMFRTGSIGLDKFPHDRWGANPGYMVADYLIRDFRQTNLFRGIFSYQDTEVVRLVLEGSITEFLAVEQKDGRKALLTVYVTLLDLNQTDSTNQIAFQKSYSYAAPCKENSAEGLAAGLSESMERLSGQIISDVYQAVKSRS
ncbi:MAG: ABC-type transport auxiliary lipoprotein family protein [Syntrophales bacterium]